MNRAAMDAAFRLLTATAPSRIQTHHQPEVALNRIRSSSPVPRSRSRKGTLALNLRIRKMKAQGATHREVMEELGVSWTTVSHHMNGKLVSLGGCRRGRSAMESNRAKRARR